MKAYEEKLLQKAKQEEAIIKTDPASVLLAYERRKEEAPERKKKKWILPLSLSSSLLAAASVVTAIVIVNNQGEGPNGIPFKPEASSVMAEELFSFHSFEGGREASSLMRRSFYKGRNEAFSSTPFYQTASSFEEYYSFFSSCHTYDSNALSVSHTVLEDPFLHSGRSYAYKGEFSYEEKSIFTLYYSDMGGMKEKKEATFFAYYESPEGEYEVTIKKEEEVDEEEREKKISLSFFNVANESDIFLIERKEEIEEKEEERSYSLERFASFSAYQAEESYLSLSFEIEKDHGQETSFEIEKGEKEFEYENILAVEEGYSFDASFDDGKTEYRFENVSLALLENGHSYSYQEENYFFAK